MTHDMIKTFVTLAETKNFNRTAELLFVAQPTISVRIKALEQEMNLKLFKRTNKSVELTTAGVQFLPYAAKLFKTLSDCQNFARNNELYSKHLTISAPVTCWDFGPLREKILSFCIANKDTLITLLRNPSAETYQKLLGGEVDLGVVYSTPANPDIEYVPFVSEKLLLVAAPSLHYSFKNKFCTENLNQLPFFVHPTYTTVLSQLIEETFYEYPRRIICDHPSLYIDLVKAGFGVGLIQSQLAEPELERGALVLLDCEYNEHPIPYKNYLAYFRRQERELEPIIDSLLK